MLFICYSIQHKIIMLMKKFSIKSFSLHHHSGALFWRRNLSAQLLSVIILLCLVLTNSYRDTSSVFSRIKCAWKVLLILLTLVLSLVIGLLISKCPQPSLFPNQIKCYMILPSCSGLFLISWESLLKNLSMIDYNFIQFHLSVSTRQSQIQGNVWC